MKKLIVNADDFGYREGINKGIIYAHQNGVVSSASLFVDREGTEEAVRMAREHPSLGLGLHLDLDKFFQVDHHAGIILGWMDPHPGIDAVRGDARRQIDKYLSFGFTADHLDSHHHAHMHPEVFPVVCQLVAEYRIPFVRFFPRLNNNPQEFEDLKKYVAESGLKTVDHFIEGWYWGNVDEDYHIAEIMTHPGYGELWREAELAHCCQPQLKDYFMESKIDLLRFSDVGPE